MLALLEVPLRSSLLQWPPSLRIRRSLVRTPRWRWSRLRCLFFLRCLWWLVLLGLMLLGQLMGQQWGPRLGWQMQHLGLLRLEVLGQTLWLLRLEVLGRPLGLEVLEVLGLEVLGPEVLGLELLARPMGQDGVLEQMGSRSCGR